MWITLEVYVTGQKIRLTTKYVNDYFCLIFRNNCFIDHVQPRSHVRCTYVMQATMNISSVVTQLSTPQQNQTLTYLIRSAVNGTKASTST